MAQRERVLRERAVLREQFGARFDEVSEALFRKDPIGIDAETNTDEYEPEAGAILPRLEDRTSEADVARVIHEEFVRWFGADIARAEPGHKSCREAVGQRRSWRMWRWHKRLREMGGVPALPSWRLSSEPLRFEACGHERHLTRATGGLPCTNG
ncbi:hypothetical protein [Citreicoccus inhibens]|uniref:hypothetical protein n=1 Tax=Citreicoccus inhibens TaxID=2849499 RepID=UPI001C25100C|nr:hypothetical protein [Citreicoccus inhibens]